MSTTVGGTRPASPSLEKLVSSLVARARTAQRRYAAYTQQQVDEVVTAAGWAIVDPDHNRVLAEMAVATTGLGNVADKITKNRRKTIGLLRDLAGARSVGVISEDKAKGLVEIARPVGVVGAVVPSTNPAATPANNIINALKGRNAIILSPSPKGAATSTKLLEYVHAELDRVRAPCDLVQQLPAPATREMTAELMRQVDLVVATGSQNNVRAAYSSGTPAIGVGAGNVAVIVDASADLAETARKISESKVFDNATSCSSENAVVILDAVYDAMVEELRKQGGVLLEPAEKTRLQNVMWPQGKLSPAIIAQSAADIARVAGLERCADASFLMVEETGAGEQYPFSGEKLSPVLTVYRARDFNHAIAIAAAIYEYEGAGHSIGIHTADEAQAMRLGLDFPVCRVIVNQAHCFANGGNFDNCLPFSLSMGCGTWGRNIFSDNLNVRQYLNMTRVVRPLPERVPEVDELLAVYFGRYGR
ncbi:MAG TPA: aldehyde dehydrogenase family protein [Casimicrobiaceae bacterium]|nr:aldehyde dehydrogenase family protein [Casimicrobiaceae bacterium]